MKERKQDFVSNARYLPTKPPQANNFWLSWKIAGYLRMSLSKRNFSFFSELISTSTPLNIKKCRSLWSFEARGEGVHSASEIWVFSVDFDIVKNLL